MKEATKEFNTEKKDRVKELIKERLQEYEMAKATVKKIEKHFDELKKVGKEEVFLLDYDN